MQHIINITFLYNSTACTFYINRLMTILYHDAVPCMYNVFNHRKVLDNIVACNIGSKYSSGNTLNMGEWVMGIDGRKIGYIIGHLKLF